MLEENKIKEPDLRKAKTETNKTVYPKNRYVEGLSPTCIYIPNKTIMFTLMRACV